MAMQQPLILVVGMHRSGTSLAASLLNSLGVSLPGPWLTASVDNGEGYFELVAVQELQNRLLVELDRGWSSAAGVLPLPEGWLDSASGLRCAVALEKILAVLAAHQETPWAIKDPRTSLLLPLWRHVAARLGIPLKLVHVIRNPAAVVQSLVRRDGSDAGMTPLRAQRLWWHYHQSIGRDGQGLPCLTIAFEDWFGERAEQQLADLAQFCLMTPVSKTQWTTALQRIKPEHRRNLGSGHNWLTNAFKDRPQRGYELLKKGKSLPFSIPAERLRPHRWQRSDPPLCIGTLPKHSCLTVVGAEASHWVVHAWLNRCPLPAGIRFGAEKKFTRICLHLQALSVSEAEGRLPFLREQAVVLDPCLSQVERLRTAGVKAFWIDPQTPPSNWLSEHNSPERCAQRFGLPNPDSLGGHGRSLWIGSLGHQAHHSLFSPHWSLPHFDSLLVADVDEARLLASWLNHCNRSGLQLVRFGAAPPEWHGDPWAALERPEGEAHWLPAPRLPLPQKPEDVEEELTWRRTGCSGAIPPEAAPDTQTLWQRPAAHVERPHLEAAVCISLYNQGSQLSDVLDSVHNQTLQQLELIIVDDNSSDDGVERGLAWLDQNGHRFRRALLIRHTTHGGVAATRNTAVSTARAPWCMVLNADSVLKPEAMELCLAVARTAPLSTAAVQPLVEENEEQNGSQGLTFSTRLKQVASQAALLVEGGRFSGLALIRRETWQRLDGYANISSEWIDLDFWCRVFEAGWHVTHCPQLLAREDWQTRTSSNKSQCDAQQRMMLRIMQSRHPWLRLCEAREP